MSMSVCLSVCLFICIYVCLSVSLSVYLYLRLSVCLSVCLAVTVSVSMYTYLPTYYTLICSDSSLYCVLKYIISQNILYTLYPPIFHRCIHQFLLDTKHPPGQNTGYDPENRIRRCNAWVVRWFLAL